jgi:diguanylate cyclase (GGDEF)-like protein
MSFAAPSLVGRVSRRDVALSPHVWTALVGTFAVFTVGVVVLSFVMPGVSQLHMLVFAGLLLVTTAVFARMRAPEPGAPTTHLVLAAVYVGPALAIYAFAPGGAAAVASATFVGPLISVWLIDRRQMVLHLILATIAILLPWLLGGVDDATLVACITLLPAIWVLSACCTLIMESAEAQGEALERLVGRDPLTGVGNRRTLDERLAFEIQRSGLSRRPLSVVALDLNGFKALNDTLGHAAGDDLLQAVADALVRAVGKHDIVVRQGGDEFCILLPEASAVAARHAVRGVRAELAHLCDGHAGVTAGIGVATYPTDATKPEALLHVADDRLRQDKLDQRQSRASSAAAPRAGMPSDVSALGAVSRRRVADANVDPAAGVPAYAPQRVTRRDLALNATVWRMAGAVYLVFTVIGASVCIWKPELAGADFPYTVAFGGSIGLAILFSRPPAIDTLGSHLQVATAYLVPWLALITCQPGGSTAIGCSIFIGALTAMRVVERRHVAAHVTLATVLFLGLIPSGLVDATTIVAILILVVTMWVISLCCVIVFEAIEAQGDELTELVLRDPLTGAGNRRRLDEELAAQLPLHAARDASLTVLALDLNGFKALNDAVGHAAGDDVLRAVAAGLGAATGDAGVVIRQGGDEFCVVLPNTTRGAAEPVIEAIRAAIGTIVVDDHTVTTGVGAATFPADATEPEALLARADERLRMDKYAGAPTPLQAARA